jgi:hypothetical protein
LSSLDGSSWSNANPNVAETNFRLLRQATNDQAKRAARLSGQLPSSQLSFVFDVIPNQHCSDPGSPQRLIGGPFQLATIQATH